MKLFKMTLPAAFALAIAVAASPAAAQGKSGGHGGGQGQAHPQQEVARGNGAAHGQGQGHTTTRSTGTVVRRGTTGTRRRSTPPGWCKGVGNPHNTAVNCSYRTDRIYRDRNGVWRDRYGNRLVNGYVYRDRTGVVRDFLGRLLR